jgi:hypothetical protein
MTNRKTLRKAIWAAGEDTRISPTDVGEAMRDLDQRVRSVNGVDVRVFLSFVYAPPFTIDTNGIVPASVLIGQVRVPGATGTTVISTQPSWDFFDGKVRVNSIGGIAAGTAYNITFLIFYEAT